MSPRRLIPGISLASWLGATVALVATHSGQLIHQSKPTEPMWNYSAVVATVADGDSFTLDTGMRVRLLGIDAPEMGRCQSGEAATYLRDRIKGKHVVVRQVMEDDFGRSLSYVYLDGTLINDAVVSAGFARTTAAAVQYRDQLEDSQNTAKQEKRGIWSDACRSTTAHDACTIKANVRGSDRLYYLPQCPYYKQVIVDTAYDDAWFCTEEEAITHNFTRSPHCK